MHPRFRQGLVLILWGTLAGNPGMTVRAAEATSVSVQPATATPSGASTGLVVQPAVPMAPNLIPIGEVERPAVTGETTLTLDIAFGIRYVPPSRASVPDGERLQIIGPDMGDEFDYSWTRNGRLLPGATERILLLDPVTGSDAGTYVCLFSTPTTSTLSSQALVLGVGTPERLVNLSLRGEIGAGANQDFIAGFVVATGARPKRLILRAVGPGLAAFGIQNPLPRPVLRVFDARGEPYTNGYVYPAVVGGPTYASDLAESLARTGAFPLPAGTADTVAMMPFEAGNYTARVTSGDGSAGTVLLEIYEVP